MVQSTERPGARERTGWRDQRLSTWHRRLGWNAPCCDIDATFHSGGIEDTGWVEFNDLEPVFIVDYKHENAVIDFNQGSLRVLRRLADRANLPAFVIRYADDFQWLEVIPDNQFAVDALRKVANHPDAISVHSYLRLSERQFVLLIHLLRSYQPSDEFLSRFYHPEVNE